MINVSSKKGLEVQLSKLKGFLDPKMSLEQYITPSDIAAMAIWHAYMKGDMEKVSVDLGCGTGILGIGALMMGAKYVFFVDNDEKALDICKDNINKLKSEGLIRDNYKMINGDVSQFSEKVDVVLQNPPFGTKVRHADRLFLIHAFRLADVIYTFHKSETFPFVKAICEDNGFVINEKLDLKMPLKAQFQFHRRQIHRIDVGFYRIIKKI